jgi:hypothetical protein
MDFVIVEPNVAQDELDKQKLEARLQRELGERAQRARHGAAIDGLEGMEVDLANLRHAAPHVRIRLEEPEAAGLRAKGFPLRRRGFAPLARRAHESHRGGGGGSGPS